MKANEFVKKFGIEKAKQAVGFGNKYAENGVLRLETFDGDETDVVIDDLKRLVESHELVEIYTRRFNGDAEWFFVSEYCKKNRISPFFSENYNKASGIYKQSIADVESCQ